MKKVFIVENHDEVLRIWRQRKFRGIDLVHIDAHMDFGFFRAQPIREVVNEAKTLAQLKSNLELSIAFNRYEKDFDKQLNVGNYIYPAMKDAIIGDFYWVIPGNNKEFKESFKQVRPLLKNLISKDTSYSDIGLTGLELKDGYASILLFDRRFIICTLQALPALRQKVLLDIDTDFLVIDKISNANAMKYIGRRFPWISPSELVSLLKNKIKAPELITIAYSVNGGWNPIKYKHLGDEIAYRFQPRAFVARYHNNLKAADFFSRFIATGKPSFYRKATKMNPRYRIKDNNYGPLYLASGKYSLAKKEFSKILKADPTNAYSLLGLATTVFIKKDFSHARNLFLKALRFSDSGIFRDVKELILLELARTEFYLGNYDKAKQYLLRYRQFNTLNPEYYDLLGQIAEKKQKFEEAVYFYHDALILGHRGFDAVLKMIKVAKYCGNKNNMLKHCFKTFSSFWKEFKLLKKDKVLSSREKRKLQKIRSLLSYK